MPVNVKRALSCSVIAGGLVAAVLAACISNSETPNAYFGRDAAPGDLGQVCRNSACNQAELACVDEDSDGPLVPTCRQTCDSSATDDPCGVGFVCAALQSTGNEGACLPANAVGEVCTGRCDDGLRCIEADVDAGTGICRTECIFDGGPECPDAGSCSTSDFCE